jgi:hypothetical protein
MNRKVFLHLAIIASVAMACPSIARGDPPGGKDFLLEVTIVTGEHSRDSNSATSTLTVLSETLAYEQTYQGARSNRRQPVRKEYKLTKEDQDLLIGLLHKGNLLVTRTISRPPRQKGSSRYFELSIRSRLKGKESLVSIDASPNTSELKADRLYQGSVAVIEQLYKIINRTDPDVTIPSLID